MAETNFGGPQDQQKADGPSSLGSQYTQRNTAGSKAADRPRVIWLDLGRSAALLGIIVFHFSRDMEMFGWLAPGTTLSGGWALFTRLIAGLFIFLSGISFARCEVMMTVIGALGKTEEAFARYCDWNSRVAGTASLSLWRLV